RFVEDTGHWEPYEILGWHVPRNWQTRRPHDLGDLACFLQEDGTIWQAKPEFPPVDRHGKINKYLAPTGNGSRAYTPPIDPCTRQIISQRYGVQIPSDTAFWDFVESRPELTIVITEGGFKSLAALDLGYICISLYGVNSGVSKFETIGGERIRKLKFELIPDLQRFAVEGRRFVLAFDQDSTAKTRATVAGAIADLSWHLEQAGAIVEVASWDGQAGRCKGVDDLVLNSGADHWHNAFDTAISATQWRIQNELARAVRRTPDLHIGDREFSEVADQLPRNGLVVLHGGKGTGKSRAIGAMLGDRSWLSSTPLISLGRDQAQSWGGVFINDGDIVGDRLLRDGVPVRGASVCIPSLLRVSKINHKILVVDETTAALEFLLNSRLANQQGVRPLLIAEHHRQAQAADLVVLADADLTEEAINYYEKLTGHRAYLVRSDRHALTYNATLLDCQQSGAIAGLRQRIDALETEKILYINSDSKVLADSLAAMLSTAGHKSLLITSETSGGADQARFLASSGAMIPEIIGRGIRAIVSSPTIAQGFSIELHTNQIDSVWGFYRGGSIAAHAIAQSLDRVRSSEVPRFVHIAKRGAAYSRLSRAQTIDGFTREFKQLSTASARLARLALAPDVVEKSEKIDWQSTNIWMLAALDVRRNRGMGALRDTVIAQLRHEGKQVNFLKPSIAKSEVAAAGQAIAAAGQAIKLVHAAAVAAVADITQPEADHLSSQTEALTPEQILQLEKFYLGQFYRTDVGTDLVTFDRNGRAQQEIRNLERILDPELATQHTASTINQNPDTPQDWSRTAVTNWLIEKSGFAALARRIYAGEVVHITDTDRQPIADFVRQNPNEFWLALGFKNLAAMSDQQIIGQLARSAGIRTKRNRRQNTYSVDISHLERVRAIIEQRKMGDPPHQIIELDQMGGSPLICNSIAVAPTNLVPKIEKFTGSIDKFEFEVTIDLAS
ncbi:MAG: DUF3854 domain-containing protein, partial [Synechococcales cyanobacterium CRU_2_2]|nr:DUF3854 domain-containing protein [Synechococcales cyanobacterium CRU_2_2]